MPAKLHRCVNKVKAAGASKNAWAVCQASTRRRAKQRKKRK